MGYYYVGLETRSHAFLLERRMKSDGIECEITFMPRELMLDLCNLGVRFKEEEYARAVSMIRRSGLPGCRVYKQVASHDSYSYQEIQV